jgi:hypothetical protein
MEVWNNCIRVSTATNTEIGFVFVNQAARGHPHPAAAIAAGVSAV